jgi:hypothetical protein
LPVTLSVEPDFAVTQMTRGQNRLVATLREAERVVAAAVG